MQKLLSYFQMVNKFVFYNITYGCAKRTLLSISNMIYSIGPTSSSFLWDSDFFNKSIGIVIYPRSLVEYL